MLTRSDLAAVVRELDDRCDAGTPVEAILDQADADPMGVTYVAEQRALRVALLLDGWSPAEIRALGTNGESRRVRLSTTAQALMTNLCATWIDGFTTGLLASATPPYAA